DGSNYMGYPFSWSTVQIYYNPKYVKTVPDSWHALLDKKYAGKISLENIPTDVMAIAARATGAKQPYSMTKAEISRAKAFLKAFKPNVLKLASQNNEVVRALADGSAWIGITNLGTDDRVKDAGGPVVKPAYPKEGTVGFIDSEQVLESAGGRRFRIAEYAGFAPALILYGVFFAVPLGIVVAYSFWKVVDYNVVHDWTVDNYRYFFSVATYVRTLWATVWVSV